MERNSRMAASGRRSMARGAVFVWAAWAAALALVSVAGCGGGGDDAANDAASRHESLRSVIETLPGALYDPPKPAPALRLANAGGAPYDLANERGRVVLLFFGFTECPDICPITMKRWAQVRGMLGADTSRVRFVFVSVDPEHDTPASAAAYAAKYHPSFVGLAGTAAEIDQIALAWEVSKGRAHTGQVFVVNKDGLIPWGYGASATLPEIVRGVKALAAAGRAAAER
ncbi:MAG TPA: SCO family protein [Candidatus Eisenbacteria bacterium]|nr:SCO family protein [Candidatus Eisenbacteria bacterium]